MSAGNPLDVMGLAQAERSDLAAFLATLTPAQWTAASLCEGWRVRDVAAHMISYDILTRAALARRFVQGGFRLNRINAIGVEQATRASTGDLLAQLTAHLTPIGLTAGFGGRIGLVDALIHHQDIRRPLGIPRTVPADRLRVALDFALKAPTLQARRVTKGLHLVATDVDWSTGQGLEVCGPAEALLMVIAGRRGVAAELTGPGQTRLRQRIDT